MNPEAELRRVIAELERSHRENMAPYYQRLGAYEAMNPRAQYVQCQEAPGLFGNLFGGGILG